MPLLQASSGPLSQAEESPCPVKCVIQLSSTSLPVPPMSAAAHSSLLPQVHQAHLPEPVSFLWSLPGHTQGSTRMSLPHGRSFLAVLTPTAQPHSRQSTLPLLLALGYCVSCPVLPPPLGSWAEGPTRLGPLPCSTQDSAWPSTDAR